MARNRKRAKERRARRPQGTSVARPGVATARRDAEAAPDPIEHASPDVELAEAQIAVGRPELSEDEQAALEIEDEQAMADGEQAALTEAEFEREEDEVDSIPGVMPERALVERAPSSGATVGEVAAPDHRGGALTRLVNFLQGSWRELQRVQWPDRRQVMQATGVVIGFVIVAGVFLGVADFLAGKLMNYVLK